jgi:hypothetical protein
MTLFNSVRHEEIFQKALNQFYGGSPDDATLTILQKWGTPKMAGDPLGARKGMDV